MNDVEALVWGGSVPIAFVLAANDVATLHPPAARYVLAPRVAYLPQLVERALEVFQQAVAPSGGNPLDNVWFESHGIALKWQLPVGTLVDAVRAHISDALLPLTIVVHFHNFPAGLLMRYQGVKAARRAYINSLKQSACLHFGSAKPVLTGLSQAQQEQMWGAIADGNYAQFQPCNDALHGSRCQIAPKRQCVRIVSIVNDSGDIFSTGRDLNTSSVCRISAILFPLEVKSDQESSEGETTPAADASLQEENSRASSDKTVIEFLNLFKENSGTKVITNPDDTKVIVHGIEIPLSAKLSEIHDRMASADNCLYLVLKTQKEV